MINKWKVKGSFDIMNDIREKFTLVKLMDTVINLNNSVSIVGHRIFDSNYKKALPLTTQSLNIM